MCLRVDRHLSCHSAAEQARTRLRVSPQHFRRPSKTDRIRGSKNDDRETDVDSHIDYRAFCHFGCVAGRNKSWQWPIRLFLSMVRDLWRRFQLRRWRWHVLLLHELAAVHDDTIRHWRNLRRESILPCATDTAAASYVVEAASSTAHLRGRSGARLVTRPAEASII